MDMPCCAVLGRDNGKISKTLSLQPFGEKGDWYLGLDVKDANNKENSIKLGLPLTGGELHTIKALSEVMALPCMPTPWQHWQWSWSRTTSALHLAGMHCGLVHGHAAWVHALSWSIS